LNGASVEQRAGVRAKKVKAREQKVRNTSVGACAIGRDARAASHHTPGPLTTGARSLNPVQGLTPTIADECARPL